MGIDFFPELNVFADCREEGKIQGILIRPETFCRGADRAPQGAAENQRFQEVLQTAESWNHYRGMGLKVGTEQRNYKIIYSIRKRAEEYV